MAAQLGSNPSYIWRSLLWSRDLLAKGLRWKVGDGNQIQTFADAWIPGLTSGKVANFNSQWSLAKVASLILPSRTWNENLIRSSFLPFEADAILNIPLGSHVSSDSRFWVFNNSGKYTVKDGYSHEIGAHLPPDNCSNFAYEDWWRFIWSLKIPPKVKIFAWRAALNFIPTEMNLRKHHIPTDGSCLLCKKAEAPTSHCIFFCPAIKHLWKNSSFWDVLRTCRFHSFMECGIHLMRILSKSSFESLIMHAWAIWKGICSIKHNKLVLDGFQSVEWAVTLLNDFQSARKELSLAYPQNASKSERKWINPPPGELRLDVDASFNASKGLFSVGVIVRNHNGEPCVAMAKSIRNPGSVLGAELQALIHGLTVCVDDGLQKVHVYSDSLLAVRAVTGLEENFGPIDTLICETRELLAHPNFLGIRHMSRLANSVAHSLARFAFSFSSSSIWKGYGFPDWLKEVVSADLSAI